ncbi:MAG: arsenic resistance N-acetyltransferase ArsN2, partial [Solirubrobacteraceae bacterium]
RPAPRGRAAGDRRGRAMTVPVATAPRRARRADLAPARALLRSAGLPLAGVDEHFDGFWTLHAADNRLAAVAGSERYGPTWLLRSLAVDPSFRGQGSGSALLAAVLAEARERGAREIFLLTTDADDFFAARGFRAVPRAAAPGALHASEELQGACPDSATLMRLEVAR